MPVVPPPPLESLTKEVQYLKGVGPQKAIMLRKLGISTIWELLNTFPRRYEDRSNLTPLAYLRPGEEGTASGILRAPSSRRISNNRSMVTALLEDQTATIKLVWFNQPWMMRKLEEAEGRQVIAFGRPKIGRGGSLEIASPEWEIIEDEKDSEEFARLQPIYALTEGVYQDTVQAATESAVSEFAKTIPETLPPKILRQNQLLSLPDAYRQIHSPEGWDQVNRARGRFVFEEFLLLQLALQMRKHEAGIELGISFDITGPGRTVGGNLFGENDTLRRPLRTLTQQLLPFQLTGAQQRVIEEIYRDMERPIPMNRLVQGDVGSGKTAVAACAMLAAVRDGYQAALMAPTEILAEQHYFNLRHLFAPLGVEVALLVGKQKAAERRKMVQAVAAGTALIVVGTHAIIQEGVEFARLGLAVVDEQHRFGVLQRAALHEKAKEKPDILVMTATPIPRTLTMTLYGDLDVSVIDELPPGRKPIRTHWKQPHERDAVYANLRKLIDQGRQAYFVCPMIAESEKMQTQAAEDLYYRLSKETYPDLRIGLLHGQMKPTEKEYVMDQFRVHELDILVSTTVIEVGVDVPNASAMVIEDANRFGLSQLHQLRGRVGRGAHQSYCVLIAGDTSADARARMEVMVSTTDGFKIAEKDLEIRGPGDMVGTRQSGRMEFHVADLVRDGRTLEEAREIAIKILEQDPKLEHPDHEMLITRVKERRREIALIAVS